MFCFVVLLSFCFSVPSVEDQGEMINSQESVDIFLNKYLCFTNYTSWIILKCNSLPITTRFTPQIFCKMNSSFSWFALISSHYKLPVHLHSGVQELWTAYSKKHSCCNLLYLLCGRFNNPVRSSPVHSRNKYILEVTMAEIIWTAGWLTVHFLKEASSSWQKEK